jgi:hypothetical protein
MTDTYTVRPGVSEGARGYTPTPGAGEAVRQNSAQVRGSSGSRTQPVYVEPLAALSLRITNLLLWPREWDGYQMAPSRESVMRAFRWIEDLYEDVPAMGEEWIDPLIVADAHGNVVFEWQNGNNRLIVYVSPETVEYLKASGPDIWSDMDDGEVTTPEDRQDLWRWLMGQP